MTFCNFLADIRPPAVGQHPNLDRIHSILAVSDRLYIFMQYAENGDLLTYLLREGHLAEPRTRRWFRQMAAGLKYLHVRDIAHRDLKCENVLITGHFNVKIGDFGFARSVVDAKGDRVLSKTYCGSTGSSFEFLASGPLVF